MIARLRKLWSDINASYWFFPGLFAFATLLLVMQQLTALPQGRWVGMGG